MKILLAYVGELYRFVRGKLIINLGLTVALGLLEGASIMMLLPLLTFAGVNGQQQTGFGVIIEKYFNISRVALPLVLLVYIGINAGHAWLQRYEVILNSTIKESFAEYLYTNVYRTVTSARWPFFLTVKKADIIHIIATELPRVSAGAHQLLQIIASGIIALIQLGMAFIIAPYLTLMIMGCGVIFSGCLQFSIGKSRKMGTTLSIWATQLFSDLSDHFNGIKEVKSYGAEAMQVKNFANHWQKAGKLLVDLAKLQSHTTLLYQVGAAVLISIFFYSAVEIFHYDPRELIIVFVIFTRLWPRFSSLQTSFQSVAVMLPALQAVTGLERRCRAEAENSTRPETNERLEMRVGIRVCNVSFRYEGNNQHYAVKHADFFIPAGTTTAVVGASGAGKSTLADLVLGLIAPGQGEIWIDGTRLDGDNRFLWRQSIGYVPQDAFLFNASIRDNLIWACPGATDEEIWQALHLAAIDEFVQSRPEKLAAVVGDRGIRLSGGERQRIVLARALLRKPALLILDEATSALDAENEKRIQLAVERLRGKLTMLVIAHRLSTIKNVDQILVMDKGRIVERGSYRSFMADRNSRFYQLACL